MILLEMKKKVLGLIEELNTNNKNLTDDPDIAVKINGVINQIMFELVRIKKLSKYLELKVTKGDMITFADLEKACGYSIYQVSNFGNVDNTPKANGTVFKINETGTAEVDLFVYPEVINDKTKDDYEFELSEDVLEIMPYGVAAHLLLSDVSAEYGSVYGKEYEKMLNRLDPRYKTASVYVDGGYSV